MESIGGLPTHVLAVHAPVVLMPLLLVLSIVLAVKSDWRRRSGLLLTGAAAVTLTATGIAVLSGRAFDEVVGDRVDTSDHARLGYITLVLIGALVIATFVLYTTDRGRGPDHDDGAAGRSLLGTASLGAVLVLALAATWWMVLTGDEGARLVWDGVIGSAGAWPLHP